MFKKSFYSLRKSKNVFCHFLKIFIKKKYTLSIGVKESLKQQFILLQKALASKDKQEASKIASSLSTLCKVELKKGFFEKKKDQFVSILIALLIAIVVRQMWFELYEIPTGSMRPTLKEKDRLTVSKTQFGINIPLTLHHLLFDPASVQRSGIVVFTGEGMDIQDVDTLYFYLFPGKKQYIKRLIGKPGDTLYFYGGRIYGLDENLNDISDQLGVPSLSQIDHVPYISFEGRALTPKISSNRVAQTTLIYQMNELVAKLNVVSGGKIEGKIETIPYAPKESKIKKFEELWGFQNYGMVRLLTKKEYLLSLSSKENLPSSDFYLEILHSPSFYGATLERDLYGRVRPTLGVSKSYIPVNSDHLKLLFDHLYTARFIVDKDGFATRYGYKKTSQNREYLPKLDGVPAGMYEFYYGKAYEVLWQGLTKECPPNHPIYQFSPQKIYTLFNLGIEFDKRFLQEGGYRQLMPSRYSFFRDGDLYLMGAPIFKKNEAAMITFNRDEALKKERSSFYTPYQDQGAPLKSDGSLDKEKILSYGLRVPKGHYLVLGDNYAMSADSRDFGFVPADNLRGVPDLIFWPFGNRAGHPNQPPYPLLTSPRVVIWLIGGFSTFFYYFLERKKKKKLLDMMLDDL